MLGTYFDPAEHGQPTPKRSEPRPAAAVPQNIHVLKNGTAVLRTFDDLDGQNVETWHVLKNAETVKRAGRSPEITAFDFDELAQMRLDPDGGKPIKELWAKGFSASMIEAANVGYRLRMIKAYCSAFQRALERQNEQTG